MRCEVEVEDARGDERRDVHDGAEDGVQGEGLGETSGRGRLGSARDEDDARGEEEELEECEEEVLRGRDGSGALAASNTFARALVRQSDGKRADREKRGERGTLRQLPATGGEREELEVGPPSEVGHRHRARQNTGRRTERRHAESGDADVDGDARQQEDESERPFRDDAHQPTGVHQPSDDHRARRDEFHCSRARGKDAVRRTGSVGGAFGGGRRAREQRLE